MLCCLLAAKRSCVVLLYDSYKESVVLLNELYDSYKERNGFFPLQPHVTHPAYHTPEHITTAHQNGSTARGVVGAVHTQT